MPNWCYNRIRIDADSDQVEQLKEIHDIFENHSDPFNQILPIPDFKNIPNEKGELPILEVHKNDKGEVICETYNFPDGKNDDRWYHWCIENWGTKWDICEVEDQQYIPSEKASLEFRCWTAWGAPIPIWDRLIKLGCTVDADYQDEGGLFEGQYRNGYNHSWKPNLEEELENA